MGGAVAAGDNGRGAPTHHTQTRPETCTLMTTTAIASPALPRLLQLVSPSLPVGGFTYSQGIEWAVEAGWLRDAVDTGHWLADQLSGPVTSVDLPLLCRLRAAAAGRDPDAFARWTDRLLAMRETAELRAEEANRGRALADLLLAFGLIDSRGSATVRPRSRVPAGAVLPVPADGAATFPAAWYGLAARAQLAGFALAVEAWGIGPTEALTGYAWGWLDQQVSAAIKLVPLGQTEGQCLLARLAATIPAAARTALDLPDAAIGAASPALAIASSNHEVQYTRLFRS